MNMNVQAVSGSFFTTSHMASIREQGEFEKIRKENPAPLSARAQQLMEVRGLKDPHAPNSTTGLNTYA